MNSSGDCWESANEGNGGGVDEEWGGDKLLAPRRRRFLLRCG